MPDLADCHPIPISSVRVPTFLFSTEKDLARHVAGMMRQIIQEKRKSGKRAVFALPAGSTPVGVYRELIRLHKEEGLDFSNVVTFNLNEYYGLSSETLQSYGRWMEEHFFHGVNIPKENIFVPDGSTPYDEIDTYCRQYEQKIEASGGIDFALLGVGRNGQIAGNEPFCSRGTKTRLCTLDPVTRESAASDFFGRENVPLQGLTMGLNTILSARQVFLLALGEHKAKIIQETCENPVTPRVPASYLQDHQNAAVFVDAAAGSALKSVVKPWTQREVDWNEDLVKRATIWLCKQSGKSLLKLSDDDFREHNLHQLLRNHGPAQAIAHRVFRLLMETIEYHPAGKEKKKVICFSPHPDDDVISMGGTLIRLNEDGHETHIAYMTSGNIAVFDHDALRVADLVTQYNQLFGIDQGEAQSIEDEVRIALSKKGPGAPDSAEVGKIKGLIRWSEAKGGALKVGCREENLHNLDMPFYRTGTVKKNPIGADDIAIIYRLLKKLTPDQIYVAGDLSDPHGTHRVCAEAIFAALEQLREEGQPLPEVMLYRGAWQEYELHEIEIAVPLSPGDMLLKKKAIFMHESQKDEALFPGTDPREFWQRAEDRNTGTSDFYNKVGLPEYYAIEAFVRWRGEPI
ncbi:MAG: 6-phosphogluconolactonase [Pirellulaceae bacterium]|nr:6-phosphogluconolactonase [Pirellulaceae bacterium]